MTLELTVRNSDIVATPRRPLWFRRTGLGSQLRWPAAAAAGVVALAHLPVIGSHLSETPYVGWLFVVLSVLSVVVALALMIRDSAIVWTATGSLFAAALLGYLISRGPGLPGLDDDRGDWTNSLGMIAVAAESLALGLAVATLLTRAGRGRTGSLRAESPESAAE